MINSYLKWLDEHDELDESIFPMDSIHTGKPYKYPPINESTIDEGDRILIDFDGVIHKYSKGWSDGSIYDEPIDGVREAINKFRNDYGLEVVIFTTRLSETSNGIEEVNKQRKMLEDWLSKYEIKVDGMTSEKLKALLYIDDNGFRFEGNWNIETFKKVLSIIQKNKY